MIGQHCGQPLVTLANTRSEFTRQCVVCRRIFRQRKRIGRAPWNEKDRDGWYREQRQIAIRAIENLVGAGAVIPLEKVSALLPVLPEWE